MALQSLELLDQYKVTPFPPGYPANARTFYSPVDNVHAALTDLLQSATKSLVIAMFGYDDDQLNQVVHAQLDSANGYVQMSLDKSQAGGVHEAQVLTSLSKWEKPRSATASPSGEVRRARSCT
jgi:hypothetical protein